MEIENTFGPVVQWIGRNFAEVMMQVRFLPGSHKVKRLKCFSLFTLCDGRSDVFSFEKPRAGVAEILSDGEKLSKIQFGP